MFESARRLLRLALMDKELVCSNHILPDRVKSSMIANYRGWDLHHG